MPEQQFMIPGGVDLIIKHNLRIGSVSIALMRLVKLFWPAAIVENSSTGEVYSFNSLGLVPEFTEFFIFKNLSNYTAWTTNGFTESLSNTMLHFIVESNQLTVVSDNFEDTEISSFVDSIKSFLKSNFVF